MAAARLFFAAFLALLSALSLLLGLLCSSCSRCDNQLHAHALCRAPALSSFEAAAIVFVVRLIVWRHLVCVICTVQSLLRVTGMLDACLKGVEVRKKLCGVERTATLFSQGGGKRVELCDDLATASCTERVARNEQACLVSRKRAQSPRLAEKERMVEARKICVARHLRRMARLLGHHGHHFAWCSHGRCAAAQDCRRRLFAQGASRALRSQPPHKARIAESRMPTRLHARLVRLGECFQTDGACPILRHHSRARVRACMCVCVVP